MNNELCQICATNPKIAGRTIYVPRWPKTNKDEIRRQAKEGISMKALALQFHLTQSRIWQILNEK